MSSQTIEPTQVAGFSQLFADGEAEEARRYGIAIDQKFDELLFAGGEFAWRTTEIPVESLSQASSTFEWRDRFEQFGRAYVYWAPASRVSVTGEYMFERFDRSEFSGEEAFERIRTHRVPLEDGTLARRAPLHTCKRHALDRVVSSSSEVDRPRKKTIFGWSMANVGYRFPKRFGRVLLEVNDLF